MENRKKLLLAGILALIAAGIGFAVRGGLLEVWSSKYGFTMTELGQITGGGLVGFGAVILFAGFLIDTIGYKRLMMIALVCHVISAVMLFAATPVFNASGKEAVYQLVSEKEANLKENKISVKSAIGMGLLGHKIGDICEIQVPAGIVKLEVLDITL